MKFDIKKMIRPAVRGFMPYVAGRPIETIKRELGLKKVYKLASNENPLGPSRMAVNAVKKAASRIFFYPDSNFWELRQAIAKKFGLKTENVMIGSGSDELIEILAKVFFKPEDEIVVSDHAFIRYKMAGDLLGCKTVTVPMTDYTHDLDAMLAAVTNRTKAVFIANPNNPTGTYNTAAEFKRFIEGLAAKPLDNLPLVVMDEAYYEYAKVQKEYPETLGYLAKYPNLVILRTFSKIYGLAGLRAGYGFSSREVVDYVDRVRPPFNVNLVAQAAAEASLKDPKQVSRSVKLVEKEKKYLYSELRKLQVPYVPTAGNFVLIEVEPLKGEDVFRKLLQKGIIVRAMGEYDFPCHIRVSIGLHAENVLFMKALKEIIAHS
ncbi:MAG: histidinol-phosphate transaminase [Elusimicrobiota bacterium]